MVTKAGLQKVLLANFSFALYTAQGFPARHIGRSIFLRNKQREGNDS